MNKNNIKIAIAGLGFGAEFIPIYQNYPGVTLNAICQRTESKLDEIGDAFNIERRYTSYDELIADPEIDAVHINTPIPDHAFGIDYISISTELEPSIDYLARTSTALINAYLSPVIDTYIKNIASKIDGNELKIITSAGGLNGSDFFKPKDSLLSGPAGGVVGAAAVAEKCGKDKIITFDMGGTSTDVARYAGEFDYQFETEIASAKLMAPSLAIHTVAAGGGSICQYDNYKFTVGPESAGAFPGPA